MKEIWQERRLIITGKNLREKILKIYKPEVKLRFP